VRENLDASLELIFGHEGGYVNAKTDRGGPTKYGITHKTLAKHRGVPSVTAAQVKALTIREAADIYRKSYWGPSGGDVLPAGLDYAGLDFGINSGPQRGVKTLQQVLGVKPDGWIGETTLAAVDAYPGGVTRLIADYCTARMAFLRSLKGPQGFSANGRGWTIRVTGKDPKGQWADQPGVIGNALAMATKQPVHKVAATPDMSTALDAEVAAKAEPSAVDAYLKPDVLLPAGGAVVTGAGTVLTSGLDPIRLAVAFAIIVIIGLGAYYAFRRIRATS
jgi:lysozyme family protein